MINTNTCLITNDNIDTRIQYNSFKDSPNLRWKPNSKYFIETNNNYTCPFQCALFTVDNKDMFFEYLDMAINIARSLSIIISDYFAVEILPIILSRKRNTLLPDILYVYVLCGSIYDNYDWALRYVYDDNFSALKNLQFFDDNQQLFVRLLNDIRHDLTSEADKRRCQNENWHALQYYSAARQLFFNSLHWDSCNISTELGRLNQLINEVERETNDSYFRKFQHNSEDELSKLDETIGQECAEIII
jgi:hypothetical protein